MGFFGKIKQNMHHGGVKVQLQAPASVHMTDATLPVTVTITATDAPAQVKSVKAEIQAQNQSTGFNPSSAQSGVNNTPMGPTTVAQEVNTQPFSLAPGQTQTIQLNITMNAGAAAQSTADPGNFGAGLAHALGNLQTLQATLDKNSYTYTLVVSADVDGIAFDPGASQMLQILKPGQFGTAVNL